MAKLDRADVQLSEPPRSAWSKVEPAGSVARDWRLLQAKKGKAAVWTFALSGACVLEAVAKRCTLDEAVRERRIYNEAMPAVGMPVPCWFGMVEEPDQRHAWIFLEHVRGVPYSNDHPVHRRLAAGWLGTLHLRGAALGPLALPVRDAQFYLAMLDEVSGVLTASRSNPALDADALRVIGEVVSSLAEARDAWAWVVDVVERYPATLMHGSFSRRNMRVRAFARSMPSLLVFDWAAAAWGSRARDVAKLASPTIQGDLGLYRAVTGLDGPLDELVAVGRLFRAIEHLRWASPKLSYQWVEGPLAAVRAQHRQLDDALSQRRSLGGVRHGKQGDRRDRSDG